MHNGGVALVAWKYDVIGIGTTFCLTSYFFLNYFRRQVSVIPGQDGLCAFSGWKNILGNNLIIIIIRKCYKMY